MNDLSQLTEDKLNLTIEIERRGEDLEFNSIDELETYAPNLPARVNTMKWRVYDFPRSCRLQPTFFVGLGVVASAPTEAWCAGAIAVVETHAKRNRLWYSWIQPWIVWLVALILGFVPLLSDRLLNRPMSTPAGAALIALQTLFWTIYFSYGRLLPRHVLVLRIEESWLRRYATELTVLLAVLSFIISVIALIYKNVG